MPRTRPEADRAGPGAQGRTSTGGLAAVAGLGILAFLFSLIATLPAGHAARYVPMPPWINGYSGTVWNGTVRIGGDHAARWRIAPLRSLAGLALSLDLGVTGPGTDLAGRVAAAGPSDLRVDGLTGPAAWPLLAALAPGLDVACDGAAILRDVAVRVASGLRTGAGEMRSGPAVCVADGAAPVEVPGLAATLATVPDGLAVELRAEGSADGASGEILGRALATADGRLLVTVTPDGAALVPGMPTSGETSLEYPLPWPIRGGRS